MIKGGFNNFLLSNNAVLGILQYNNRNTTIILSVNESENLTLGRL